MSTNTYKEQVIKLAKQIKKEHFLKLGLWIAGISLTLVWIAMVLATSISAGNLRHYGEAVEAKSQEQFNLLINSGYEAFISSDNKVMLHKLEKITDMNPLCLTYSQDLIGWYICILFAPIGYLGIIYIIAVLKNMITPSAIKKTVRKALQFNYLKQKDVDYIIDEIDYNIGLKERPTEENIEQNKENNI